MAVCSNCGKYTSSPRKGLCVNCYRFEKRTGSPRPYRDVDGRGIGCARGKSHYAWKGDAAGKEAKHRRAVRLYPLDKCNRCGKPAIDRHHKDGDPGNNRPENVEPLCRRCHMKADGRLYILYAYSAARELVPPKPCRHCGRLRKPLRRGLCSACSEYLRRHGIPRPLRPGTGKGASCI